MKRFVLMLAAAAAAAYASAATSTYTVDTQALRNKAGVTDVYVTVTPPTGVAAPGTFKQVQLKSFDSAGTLRWTKNVSAVPATGNPAVSQFSYNDVGVHQAIQTQVLLQTSATTNTEVYRQSTPALLRPDLKITKLDAPKEVNIGQPIQVTATINELNGDLGIKNAVLTLTNGAAQLDTATLTNVNKSGSASVLMTTSFTTPGTYTLTATLSGGAPSEYDTSNNTASTTVVVKNPTLASNFYTAYWDQIYSWHNKGSNIYGDNWEDTGHNNNGYIYYQVVSVDPARTVGVAPQLPWKATGYLNINGGTPLMQASDVVIPLNYKYDNPTADVGCFNSNQVTPGGGYSYGGGSVQVGNATQVLVGGWYTVCGQTQFNAYFWQGWSDVGYVSKNWNTLYGTAGQYSYASSDGVRVPDVTAMQGRLILTLSDGTQFGGSGDTSSATVTTYPLDSNYAGSDGWSTWSNTSTGVQHYMYVFGQATP